VALIRVGETTITAFISNVPPLASGASYLLFENGVPNNGDSRCARTILEAVLPHRLWVA